MKDIDRIQALEDKVIKLEATLSKLSSDTILEALKFLNELEEFYKSDNKDNLIFLVQDKKNLIMQMLNNEEGETTNV